MNWPSYGKWLALQNNMTYTEKWLALQNYETLLIYHRKFMIWPSFGKRLALQNDLAK